MGRDQSALKPESVSVSPFTNELPFTHVSEARRRNMAAIRGKNTGPELIVRKLVHSMGYRYTIHNKNLPGRPDVVFPSRRKIIDVRGCFWHRHFECRLAAVPRTRQDFWLAKFQATIARDERNLAELNAAGWNVLIVWQCEIRDEHLIERLQAFLKA